MIRELIKGRCIICTHDANMMYKDNQTCVRCDKLGKEIEEKVSEKMDNNQISVDDISELYDIMLDWAKKKRLMSPQTFAEKVIVSIARLEGE